MAEQLNASAVTVAVTGLITKLPNGFDYKTITVDSVLPTGSTVYGYTDEDGVSFVKSSDSSDIVAWQNSATVRTIRTNGKGEMAFKLMENSKVSRELYYGSVEVNGKISINATKAIRGAFVFDYFDNSGENGALSHQRFVLPNVEAVANAEVVFNATDAVKYDMMLNLMPDVLGNIAYSLIKENGTTPTDPTDPTDPGEGGGGTIAIGTIVLEHSGSAMIDNGIEGEETTTEYVVTGTVSENNNGAIALRVVMSFTDESIESSDDVVIYDVTSDNGVESIILGMIDLGTSSGYFQYNESDNVDFNYISWGSTTVSLSNGSTLQLTS